MDDSKYDDLEARLAALERKMALLEEESASDERRNRRTRALNMWLRIALYATALILMVFFLWIFKGHF